jgi:hypothetical protein
MKQQLLVVLGFVCCFGYAIGAEFEAPVRLKADGVVIRVERP